jgi:hypothetical protein
MSPRFMERIERVRSPATLDPDFFPDLEMGESIEPLPVTRQPAQADPRIWGNNARVVLTPVRQNATEIPTPPRVVRQRAFSSHYPSRDYLNNDLNSIYIQN